MKISYLVTCHNEAAELSKVVGQLCEHIYKNSLSDEVVILDDFSDNADTIGTLRHFANFPIVKIYQHKLDKDFGVHKTVGSRQCTGEYIFQLDADEYPAQTLLENLHELVESNPDAELYKVPRVNIVRGLTQEDVDRWGWRVYELPEFPGLHIVNWEFDHQARIYKNVERIRWDRKLHETIVGAKGTATLPLEVGWAIIHDKTIDRQRKQNDFYAKNWSVEANMGKG